MPFLCAICSEAYTTNGTRHALFSTKCGHLFGKSCLERWIQEKSRFGRFECPTCRKLLLDSDYHPIYDVPNEFFEFQLDDKTRQCISGTLKEKHFFIKKDMGKHEELSGKIIEFFGTSNRYILIAGYDVFNNDSNDFHNSSYEGSYFLKIYEGDHVCYNRNFGPDRITAVAVNNYCKDDIEFCVGFSNGDIHNTVFYLTNGVRQTPHVSILFKEKEKINSICYLGYNDIVYSVGHCHIFNIHTDRMNFKKNWLGNSNIKLRTVTNLNMVNDHVLLGIMNRKIYVFEKDKPPYVVYSEKNSNVTSYAFNSVTNTILISALEPEDEYDGREYIKLQFKLRGINKTYICENSGSRNEVYTSYSLLNFQDNNNFNYHLTSRFKSSPVVTKRYEENFIYTFIPYTGNDTLRVYVVNICSNELLMEEKIRNLHSCIGVTALDTPKFVNSKMIRIPIVVILDDDFMMYNFYSSIE